jgi:three-Cys-motif partner protein
MAVHSHDHLFDPVAFNEVGRRESAVSPMSELLRLDSAQTLVLAPDGYHARQVGLHSLDKAHYARYYAEIVGTAMKTAYPGPLAWVELFAGPGMLRVKDLNEFKPGSPLEAIGVRDPFDHYVFVDQDARCVRALQARVGGNPRVSVLQGDANGAAVDDAIVAIVPRNALVVLYADPAALDIDFTTIRFFADRYKHLDLLLNVPVPGVYRALRAGYQGKASRVLNHPAPAELIGPTSGRPNVSLREWFERQLRRLGYEYFASEVIKLHQNNSPLYDLMLASRSERAKQFFEEAQKRGPTGQYRFDFF